ncbi:MAG: hypothetical protein ACJ74Q_24415 [Pyrinomonadaceae bacterium]
MAVKIFLNTPIVNKLFDRPPASFAWQKTYREGASETAFGRAAADPSRLAIAEQASSQLLHDH